MRIPTRYELKQMEREQDKKYILGTCAVVILVDNLKGSFWLPY